ncbi:MAG: hypothetical protein ACOX7H_04550 [Bacillota bacterium]
MMNNLPMQTINERLLYQDRFSVSRQVSLVQPNKSIRKVIKPVPELQDIPCAFSNNSHSSSYPNKMMDKQYHGYGISVLKRIFCASKHELLPGDTVFVTTRAGYKRRFVAGEAMKYLTHQEILLQTKAEA